jgi:hypothetical protein
MKLIICILLFSSLYFLNAESSTFLIEIARPKMIAVDDNHLYVSDQCSIFVFSLKDYKLLKRLGRRGQGPGEYSYRPSIQTIKNGLLATSLRKYCVYSDEQKLIKEKPLKEFFSPFMQVGNSFVVQKLHSTGNSLSVSVWIYNDILTPKKLLYKPPPSPRITIKSPIELVKPKLKFACFNEKIFLTPETEDFYIEVYNTEGKKIASIRRPYKRIKITDERKKKLKEVYWEIPIVKKNLEWNKKRSYIFPEYFHAINDFTVADNKLFVKTFANRNGQEEHIILDLDGNYQKTVYLPEAMPRFYSINKNKFYYIKENEDEETWELNVISIL